MSAGASSPRSSFRITFQLNEREHVALVGTNGAGKSSLLKIIARSDEPTTGSIVYQTGLRVAYQAQEAHFAEDRTLYEEALDAFSAVRATGERLSALEQEMAGLTRRRSMRSSRNTRASRPSSRRMAVTRWNTAPSRCSPALAFRSRCSATR
jgi:ATPase subunit of ABC transporter with duplicated ATPase domains